MSRDAKRQKLQRRRERDFREKKLSRAFEQAKPSKLSVPRDIQLLNYTVTFDAVRENDSPMDRLHALYGDEVMEDLHYQAQKEPLIAIPRLEAFIEKHPNVPPLYNWLAVAHIASGNETKADEINRLNYDRNPEYLFAIVNICVKHLVAGEVSRATEILNGRHDLKLIYPGRDVFHVTEAMSFYYLMVMYYVKTDKLEPATALLRVMERLQPANGMTMAARLLVLSKAPAMIFPEWMKRGRRNRDGGRESLPGFSAGAR